METEFNKNPDHTEKKLPKWIILIVVIFALPLLLGGFLYLLSQIEKPPLEKVPTELEQREIAHWLYFPNLSDIRDIYFDEDGDTLWIASASGLHKYSRSKGEILKTYTAANGLPKVATAVTKINNEIYIGTQGGVTILDLATDKFRYLYDRNDHTLNGNIDHFEFDGQKLWMTTFGGLRSFDITSQEWRNYAHPDSDFTITGNDIYLIERRNPNPIIWHADKTTGQWEVEFQLPNYDWMYIDSSNRYLVALADPENYRQNSVLYYKNLPDGKWSEIKLPIDGSSIRYRKLAIDSEGKVYFTYRNNKEKFLVVYNLDEAVFNQYTLGEIGDVGATRGNVYPYLPQNEVWFASSPLGYIQLDSGTIHFALDSRDPTRFDKPIAYQNGKLIVNTDLGVGIFDPRRNSFTRISKEQALDAEWIEDIIWLDLSVIGMGIGEVKLGKYDTRSKTLETETLEHPFSFVKSQKPRDQNSVLIAMRVYEKGKSITEIILFDIVEKKKELLLKIDSSSLNRFNTKPLYSEQYGILINTKDGIKSLDPITKEYKLLFDTPFTPVFTRTNSGELFALSDTGNIYRLEKSSNAFTPIWNFVGPQFSKPNSFEIFKDSIAIKSVTKLPNYNPGADYGFGPGGYSFYKNQILLIDFKGTISDILDSSNGMMSVDFSGEMMSDESCLWFSSRGIWAYCKET